MTPLERATATQTAIEAAFNPGGALRQDLEDLICKVELIALDAAGVPESEPSTLGWDLPHDPFDGIRGLAPALA